MLFSIVVALTDQMIALFCALFFSMVLMIVARLKQKHVALRLLLVNSFIFFLWFFIPFTYPGSKTLFSVGTLNLSAEGVHYALIITLKSNAIIMACLALLGTSSLFSLVHALRHLYVPEKLVNLFFFCYRYLHVVHHEYNKLSNAMKIRCFQPGTNVHTYKTYAYLLGMLIIKSFERSERVYQAMLCRGFKGEFWMLEHFQLKRSDVISGVVLFLFTVGLMLFPWEQIMP